MKLALLLLACFVCVSQQERYIWPFPVPTSQAVYKPLFYSDGLPAGYDVVRKVNSQNANTIGRSNAATFPQQGRLFVNLLTASLYLFTSTKSVTSTVTSTVTTATVIKCIPSTQFSSSTTACGRRRRDTEELLAGNAEEPIQPDLPKPLEATAVFDVFSRDIEDTPLAAPEIISSQKEEPTALSPDGAYQQRAFTTTVTTTAYTTSYVFTATSLTSTVSIGISTGLLCLPTGYSVC